MNVVTDVPQGSVLGPILFNVLVNDFSKVITDFDIIQYADDTQFIHTDCVDALPDLIERTEATLSLATSYFNTNQSINGGIRRGPRRLANPTTPNRGVPPG